MKYNENDIRIKRSIPSVDYCKLVDSIVQVQLFVDEYHPEYLTTALPSIIAHVAIEGIEWEDDEKNMFNDDVAQAVLQDDGILGETVRAIQFGYFGIDNVGDILTVLLMTLRRLLNKDWKCANQLILYYSV